MSNEILICKESAMVPVEDDEGNEVPTLLTKDKTTAHAGHFLVDRYPELWKPLKVDWQVDDGEPDDDEPSSSDAPSNNPVKKAVAKAVAKKTAAKKTAAPEPKQD